MITEAAVSEAFEELIQRARMVSADVADEVTQTIEAGLAEPLTDVEAERLVRRIVDLIREGARQRGDHRTLAHLEADPDGVVAKAMAGWRRGTAGRTRPGRRPVKAIILDNHNGIYKARVIPTPRFHGRDVAMRCGYARTRDIVLWEENQRLEIHTRQFHKRTGRAPTPEELLSILHSKMPQPGLSADDEFKIVALARSIASNGVQKPPILDVDGTLLDGNRRVAACYHILSSSEFSSEEKRKAEFIFIWQLTEFADEEDRRRVVVALNFETDHKQQWPDYVRARKVWEDWQAMLALEIRPPGQVRQTEIKRELSQKYALGPDPAPVTRYLKMVQWAEDFEEYHTEVRGRDEFEVRHKASEKFQYFDELSKGSRSEGGVARTLEQDEQLRHLVFELLFQDKFKNWRQIRQLRYLSESADAQQVLKEAKDEPDVDLGQHKVEVALDMAVGSRPEARLVGANERISTFVRWLEAVPVSAFRDSIKPENLRALLGALRLVEHHARAAAADEG